MSRIVSKNNNITQLPVGTILMYDGASWINNSTIIGWYKCDGTNGTPNLIDKFIKGNSTSGSSGGSNTKTISANNLPLHTHNIDHTHTGSTNITGSHTHTEQCTTSASAGGSYRAGRNKVGFGININSAGSHTHTITINTYSGSSGNNSTTASDLDIQPSYYTVIFIKKMS